MKISAPRQKQHLRKQKSPPHARWEGDTAVSAVDVGRLGDVDKQVHGCFHVHALEDDHTASAHVDDRAASKLAETFGFDAAVQAQRVTFGRVKVQDLVTAGAVCVEHECVCAVAARQAVVAGATGQDVITSATADFVIAQTAVDDVITTATCDAVVASAACKTVVTNATLHVVVTAATADEVVAASAIYDVVTACTVDLVVAVIRFDNAAVISVGRNKRHFILTL
ncbi:MAG: hypothetical protein AAFQ59_16630, partial [Pseudomonadota bacterium]